LRGCTLPEFLKNFSLAGVRFSSAFREIGFLFSFALHFCKSRFPAALPRLIPIRHSKSPYFNESFLQFGPA